MNSSFYTDPIVDPLVHVKYESALSLGGERDMAHETRSTHIPKFIMFGYKKAT